MNGFNFKNFIEIAIDRIEFIQGLNNELAMLSALNGLKGYLNGGLEVYKIVEEVRKEINK